MKKEGEGFLLVLTQISELSDQILALGKNKREILVSGKTQGLEDIVKQEEVILRQLDKLETARRKMLQEFAAKHGIEAQDMVLSEIIKAADSGLCEQIEKIGGRIKETVAEIGELNQLNNRLIQQGLFFVNCSINLLVQNQAEPVYGMENSNTANKPRGRLLIDQKV